MEENRVVSTGYHRLDVSLYNHVNDSRTIEPGLTRTRVRDPCRRRLLRPDVVEAAL